MRPRIRLAASVENVLPPDLRRTTPRQVAWTAAGWAAIAGSVILAAGSAALSVFLWTRLSADAAAAAELARSGLSAEATITQVRRARGSDAQTNLRYRYIVDGRNFEGRGRLRKRDPRRDAVGQGSAIAVRYLPSDPSHSWIEGNEPGGTPPVVAALAPLIFWPVAGLILRSVRREKRLLAEGRAAMARVTNVKKSGSGHETAWTVQYEWRLLSGGLRKGKTRRASKPPDTGSYVPVLYDPDNPRHHAAWPLWSVRMTRF